MSSNTPAPAAAPAAAPTPSDNDYKLGRDNLVTDAKGDTYEVNTSSGTRMVNRTSASNTDAGMIATRSVAGPTAGTAAAGTSATTTAPGVVKAAGGGRGLGTGADGYRRGRENISVDAQGNTFEVNTSTGTRMIDSAAGTGTGKDKMVEREGGA